MRERKVKGSMSEMSQDLGTGRASLGRVLDFAWDARAFTASEALAATSLTRSTAIEAIDTLVGINVLRELPNARAAGEYRAGRPARRFELPPDLGAVIGLDAGDTHVRVRIADLGGRTLAQRRGDLDFRQSIPERQAAIVQVLTAAVDEAAPARVFALCAGVAAPVTRDGFSPPHPEGLWERTNAGLVDLLAPWARVIEVKNDAQLAATAVGTTGEAAGCRDYVALLAGRRLGAGVVIDGHLLHGAHGGVGEMFAFDNVRGVDSAFGLGPAIESEARTMIVSGLAAPGGGLSSLDPEAIDAQQVLELAAEGDPDSLSIARCAGERLARIVGVLGNMFDPERVVVCGAIADGIEPVLEAARTALKPHLHLPAPELVRSELGEDIVLQGATLHALRTTRREALPRLAEELLAVAKTA